VALSEREGQEAMKATGLVPENGRGADLRLGRIRKNNWTGGTFFRCLAFGQHAESFL
jgi:hypothetical protein